jgi:hypothetical protein
LMSSMRSTNVCRACRARRTGGNVASVHCRSPRRRARQTLGGVSFQIVMLGPADPRRAPRAPADAVGAR